MRRTHIGSRRSGSGFCASHFRRVNFDAFVNFRARDPAAVVMFGPWAENGLMYRANGPLLTRMPVVDRSGGLGTLTPASSFDARTRDPCREKKRVTRGGPGARRNRRDPQGAASANKTRHRTVRRF